MFQYSLLIIEILKKDQFKDIKYYREREVRVQFYNVSKIIYKIPKKIQRNKLAYIIYGILWENERFKYIDYGPSSVAFNYIAYDGIIVKPEEIFYRDKGIRIDLTRNEPLMLNEDWKHIPDLWALTID